MGSRGVGLALGPKDGEDTFACQSIRNSKATDQIAM
jgi:hypothetical protein